MYRRLILSAAPLYIRALWGNVKRDRIDWVEAVKPDLFEFRNVHPEQADSFMAICKKAS